MCIRVERRKGHVLVCVERDGELMAKEEESVHSSGVC